MKIALVNPFQIFLVNKAGKIYNRVWPPLALANCGALLESQGHQVKIIDANALKQSPEEVAQEVVGFDKVFISSSSLDRWQCPNVDIGPFLNTVASVKRQIDEVYLLGVHGTVKPEELLTQTQARALIRGEPEMTITEICQGKPLNDVMGVAFLENGNLIVAPDQKPLNLNDLPLPAFHLLPLERYHYEALGRNFVLFEGSRGCSFQCDFCLLAMYGKGIRRKSFEKLVHEIDYAVSCFGVQTGYFIDLEFTLFRSQVVDLCEYLIKKKYDFRWTCQTRFDLVDEALLEAMEKAGCRLIHFGVEAGTDRLLQSINKKMTVKQIEEGMEMVHKTKIETACFFMLGFPDSTREEIEETIDFARRLNPTYALFHLTVPYPGTPLYEKLPACGRDAADENLYPEACLKGKELEALKRTVRNAYLGFYLRPKYIYSRLSRGEFRSLYRQVKLFLEFL